MVLTEDGTLDSLALDVRSLLYSATGGGPTKSGVWHSARNSKPRGSKVPGNFHLRLIRSSDRRKGVREHCNCKPNACGDGNCVNNVNGYTYNCYKGHELLLLRGQRYGTFPLSLIIRWSPRNRDEQKESCRTPTFHEQTGRLQNPSVNPIHSLHNEGPALQESRSTQQDCRLKE